MTNTCLGRCARKCFGRNTDNRSFTTMKLLTRVGRDRCFTEGGAVTRLSYLDPKAPDSNGKERITDASFYMESLMELRVWASAADLANLALDSRAAGSLVKIGGRAHTAVVPTAEQEDNELTLDTSRAGSSRTASPLRRTACKQETLWRWLMNPSSSTVFRGWQPRHATGEKSVEESMGVSWDHLSLGHPFQHWKNWWHEQRQRKHNWSRFIHKILRTVHAQQCAGLVTYGHALRLLGGKMSLKLDPKMLEPVHNSFDHLKMHARSSRSRSSITTKDGEEKEEEEESKEHDEAILRDTR